jgi:palmitoyltransferase
MFLLIYIIALALGIAVGAMFSWHLYLISKGETSVENHDFGTYRKLAKGRGQVSTRVAFTPIYT